MAHFKSMVDMAKSPAEVKEAIESSTLCGSIDSVPVYPYGLCIALCEEELAKLGLGGEMPTVGQMIHLAAMAKVTSVSESEREGKDGTKEKSQRLELQITHLATEHEDEEAERAAAAKARRGRFYDKVDAPDI